MKAELDRAEDLIFKISTGTDKQRKIEIPHERQGEVRSWSEMSYYLEPFGIEKRDLKFARAYFRGQKLLAEDKKVKARRLFKALDKIHGYQEFENKNPFLLRTIDVAVKKVTNRDKIINS